MEVLRPCDLDAAAGQPRRHRSPLGHRHGHCLTRRALAAVVPGSPVGLPSTSDRQRQRDPSRRRAPARPTARTKKTRWLWWSGEGEPDLDRFWRVDLDIGRVQVNRRACGDELRPTLLTERGETPTDELAYRRFHVDEDRVVEAARRPMNVVTAGICGIARGGAPAQSTRWKSRSHMKSPPNSIVSATESTVSPALRPRPRVFTGPI